MVNGDVDNMLKWQVSEAEFRGFVKAKLMGIEKKQDNICKVNDIQQKQIDKNKDDITGIKAKAGVIGTVMGFIAGLLAAIFKGRIL